MDQLKFYWKAQSIEGVEQLGMRFDSEILYGVGRHGGAYKNMKTLLRHKLTHHDSSKCMLLTLILKDARCQSLVPGSGSLIVNVS